MFDFSSLAPRQAADATRSWDRPASPLYEHLLRRQYASADEVIYDLANDYLTWTPTGSLLRVEDEVVGKLDKSMWQDLLRLLGVHVIRQATVVILKDGPPVVGDPFAKLLSPYQKLVIRSLVTEGMSIPDFIAAHSDTRHASTPEAVTKALRDAQKLNGTYRIPVRRCTLTPTNHRVFDEHNGGKPFWRIAKEMRLTTKEVSHMYFEARNAISQDQLDLDKYVIVDK